MHMSKDRDGIYKHLKYPLKLGDYQCETYCYDLNDCNKEINNWLDKMFVQLNGKINTDIVVSLMNFWGNIYSRIILDYLFDFKNQNISDIDNYNGLCWIELNATTVITNQLWNLIKMTHNFNFLKLNCINCQIYIDHFLFHEQIDYNRTNDTYLSYHRNKQRRLSVIKQKWVLVRFIPHTQARLNWDIQNGYQNTATSEYTAKGIAFKEFKQSPQNYQLY